MSGEIPAIILLLDNEKFLSIVVENEEFILEVGDEENNIFSPNERITLDKDDIELIYNWLGGILND